MKFRIKAIIACLLIVLDTVALASGNVQESDQLCPSMSSSQSEYDKKAWEVTLSPYTHHWHGSPDHKNVYLGSLERLGDANRFCGLALFSNSFGQNSAYAYAGKRWDHFDEADKLFIKVSAGFIYGYRGLYKNKIPLNNYGVAPAIIPSVGYSITPLDSAQVIVLGNAGVMFALGHSF